MQTSTSVASVLRHRGSAVHREGRAPLLVASGVFLSWVLWSRQRSGGHIPPLTAALSLGSLAFLVQFFRHPGCDTVLQPGLVVAPSYGRIVHVGIEDEPEILAGRRIRLSIFLSLFDPHLTRSPVAGRVTYQRYHPGRYLVALHPKASELNERNSVLIRQDDGVPILVREIAGLVARRICSYVQPGSRLSAGEEIGYIKLGSRVDVFLPPDATILVKRGQRVTAGETPIARLAASRT